MLIFRCENIPIILCSNCSSFTSADMPRLSRLFFLVYWCCLFEAFSKSNNLASSFSHFFWTLIFSSLSASITESFTFSMLSVTILFTVLAKLSFPYRKDYVGSILHLYIRSLKYNRSMLKVNFLKRNINEVSIYKKETLFTLQ